MKLHQVIKSAEVLHKSTLKNIYVCKNDKGHYYANEKDLRELNIKDFNEGLNPIILGYWAYDVMTKQSKFYSLI